MHDIESIKSIIPEVEYITPEIIFETNFMRNARLRSGKIVGVNNDYFSINNFDIAEGDSFTEQQIKNAAPVCVIGHDVKTKFFPGEDPIGKMIKVGELWLTVVGVLEKKDLSTENIESLGIRNYNLDVFLPANTLLLRFKNRALVTKNDLDASGGFGGGVIIFGLDNEGEEEATTNYHQLDKLIVRVSDT